MAEGGGALIGLMLGESQGIKDESQNSRCGEARTHTHAHAHTHTRTRIHIDMYGSMRVVRGVAAGAGRNGMSRILTENSKGKGDKG